jgi:hypothetical protein
MSTRVLLNMNARGQHLWKEQLGYVEGTAWI